MGSPGPSPRVTPADALTVFTERGDGVVPLTATEVAEALDCSRRTAYDKLETLAERGELASKKVGAKGRVWWRPTDVVETDDRTDDEAGTDDGARTDDEAGTDNGARTDDEGSTVEATQFEELVDTVADYAIFLLDEEGHVRTWNRGAERLKGYEESEIVGDHFSTFYTDEAREASVPERNLARATRDGRAEDEGWRLRADGSRFWANVVITALRDDDGEVTGYAKVTRDMTERHESEEQLQAEKERFETLVREVEDYAIFMLDPSGIVESWNAGIEEIKGYEESEIVGEHFSTFYTEAAREERVPERNLAYAARDGRVEDEGWRLRADGSQFWANVVITALRDDDGHLRGFAKVTRDMTERHEYEERLERQRNELDELDRINALVRDVDQTLVGATDRAEIEAALCDRLAASETSLGVWFGAFDAQDTALTPRASAGLGDGPQAVLADDGDDGDEGPFVDLGRRALATGTSVTWNDDRKPDPVSDADAESVIAFPIVYEDAEYGVLFLHHRPDDSFDERQREVLEELCGTVGHAIAAIERKEREETLTTLHESTRALLRTESPEEVGDVVVRTVTEELGLDDALVLGFETATNTLEPLSSSLDREVDEMATLSAADDSPAWTSFVEERTITLGPDDDPILRTAELANHGELVVPLSDHGVLVATTRSRDAFDPDSRKLVELVAAWAEAAMDRVEQRANVRERDEILQERNRRLKRLDRINTLVRDVDRALVQASTVEEVRRVVCERLTEDDRFEFAWIGEAGEGEDLLARAWCGEERSYLDEVDFASPANDSEPAVRALRSKNVAVVSNVATDLRAAPWRKTAFAREFQSALGVPLRYGDVTYGVLTVYANEPDVFDDVERSVFPVLGETIANAIDGVQTKQALLTDRTAELEFRLTDESASALSRIAVETGCRVVLDGAVPSTEGSVRLYATTHDVDREAVEAAAADADDVASVRHVWTEDRTHRFEVTIDGASIPVTLRDLGASLRDLRVTDEEVRVVVDVPASTDVRQFVRQFQDVYPSAEFVARRQREDLDDSPEAYRVGLDEALTDRQREVLQTAYHSGFFDSPRRSTGEDVAEALGVSQPTVTEHLRTAQAKLLDAVVGDDVAVDATASDERGDGDA